MSRVDFYHLQTRKLEDVLPLLLQKAYAIGKKIVVRVGNVERVDFLNSLLWSYDEEAFLPHGCKKDGNGELQPIWLTADNDVPNQADFLFLVDGAIMDENEYSQYERVFNIFDGTHPDSLNQARSFWKQLKQASADIFYWQQNTNGVWERHG